MGYVLLIMLTMLTIGNGRPIMSIIPPQRVSTGVKPVLQLYWSCEQAKVNNGQITVTATDLSQPQGKYTLLKQGVHCTNHVLRFPLDVSVVFGVGRVSQADLADIRIDIELDLGLYAPKEYSTIEYQVVNNKKQYSNVLSTRLLDGTFIDLYHFSETEALYYDTKLKNMTAQDWDDQIKYMAQNGIKIAIIQALFLNNDYVIDNVNETCDNYGKTGQAFYPSKIYPKRFPFKDMVTDKVEVILSAADKYGINVFMGLGIFAWFDYRNESLCWSKRIAKEIYEMYGHHKSLYGWYIAQEMAGDFFYGGRFYYPQVVSDMIHFFSEFKKFANSMNPLMPIMTACNSYNWDKHANDWVKILEHVDIVTPFGMARVDPEWHTLSTIVQVCNKIGTRVWVDMEMFAEAPLITRGVLVPKTTEELIAEIRKYDNVEQICGYEFTGLMDSPESKVHLGGDAASALYVGYGKYYSNFK